MQCLPCLCHQLEMCLLELISAENQCSQNRYVFFNLKRLFTCIHSPGAKTIKKNTNSTQNKSQTHRAKQYEVTSFLSTDYELSIETCSKNVSSLGPLVTTQDGAVIDWLKMQAHSLCTARFPINFTLILTSMNQKHWHPLIRQGK